MNVNITMPLPIIRLEFKMIVSVICDGEATICLGGRDRNGARFRTSEMPRYFFATYIFIVFNTNYNFFLKYIFNKQQNQNYCIH